MTLERRLEMLENVRMALSPNEGLKLVYFLGVGKTTYGQNGAKPE